MGKRIVTTDVELVSAITDELANVEVVETAEDAAQFAWNIVHALTRPPEKTSDITGFKEDDVPPKPYA